MSVSYRPEWGLYWPDWDQKAEKNHAYILKNLPTMNFAISQCKKFDVCVQAGGHVGIWPISLSEHFKTVYTFEPEKDLFYCLCGNVDKHPTAYNDVIRQESALSDTIGKVLFKRSSSSGSSCVDPFGMTEIQTTTIDSLNLTKCDAIFLDIEGHEPQALKGAEQTIRKFKPVIQVEELDPMEHEVGLFLKGLGYRPHPEKQGKDRVYLPC